MATRIRLQRHGKKRRPIYYIVVTDSRRKRDGIFLEKLGLYNPNTNPATIDLNDDRTLEWVMKGAQPSNTARAILSYRGIMYKKHLLRGVEKGALTEEEADKRYAAWLDDKSNRIQSKIEALAAAAATDAKERFANETKVKEARTAAVKAKQASALKAEIGESAPEAVADDSDAPASAADVLAAASAGDGTGESAEAASEAKAEAPAEEAAAPEAKAEEAAPEVKADASAEAGEAKAEEAAPEAKAEEAPAKDAKEESKD